MLLDRVVFMQVVSIRISRNTKGVMGQWYVHLRSRVSNGLNIVSDDDQGVRRANCKVFIKAMQEVLNVVVSLQEPLKGIE